jgi:hypothetical protein
MMLPPDLRLDFQSSLFPPGLPTTTWSKYKLHSARILLNTCLVFDPENKGNVFLGIVGLLHYGFTKGKVRNSYPCNRPWMPVGC